ncbi:unnamed protein product [Larinioides sclopetarius]|uniref:G-protein coupled receptors family 1 profile domain-containing protein n=1 Tax=Larinioides sclopetarius TaxID=280406 RepID=A0AAV2BPL8_9ARAC
MKEQIMIFSVTSNDGNHLFDNWTNSSLSISKYNNTFTLFNENDNRRNHLEPPLSVSESDLISVVCLSILLSFIILTTIAGNIFVLAAILRERNLQTLSNYLVFSLAIADLMVACLVMPIGAQYEVMNQEWILGSAMCEIWTSGDVLCCTASILHLVAIAVDRYCAVTNINYVQYRSPKKVGFMIVTVWSVSFLVSFAPILGWKDEEFLLRIQIEKRCLVSQDIGFQIFATCATFYVPLMVILILYWRIYQVVRKRIRHRPGNAIRPAALLPLVCAENITDMASLNGSAKTVQHIVKFAAEEPRPPRDQAREESRQDACHHHWRLRRVLAALLRHGPGDGSQSHAGARWPAFLHLLVARVCQFYPQPAHLHCVQSGLQEGVLEALLQEEATGEGAIVQAQRHVYCRHDILSCFVQFLLHDEKLNKNACFILHQKSRVSVCRTGKWITKYLQSSLVRFSKRDCANENAERHVNYLYNV